MGNQVSHGHHGLPVRHRRDSDCPALLPAHVPPAAVAVPAGRPRHGTRLDTPATFETPPCINVRPSAPPSSSPDSVSVCESSSSSSSSCSPPAPLTPHSERWQEDGTDESGPRPRARTTNNFMMERHNKTGRVRQVPTVFR